jgi:long-subunit acyl-CoA synthetase (AMP-forming)
MSESLSYAMLDKGLASSFDSEERMWNFIGIIGINRQEWVMTQAANMMAVNTTVPLYETLGLDAMKFVIDQTKLKTVFMTHKWVSKLLKMFQEDTTGKMSSLQNFVVFE